MSCDCGCGRPATIDVHDDRTETDTRKCWECVREMLEAVVAERTAGEPEDFHEYEL